MAADGVVYTTDVSGVTPAELEGFFVDWPSPPSPDRHLEILRRRHLLAAE